MSNLLLFAPMAWAQSGQPATDALVMIFGFLGFILMVLVYSVIVFISIFIYFLPSIIARSKDHPQRIGIVLLNILLGWTLIGWTSALIWSFIIPTQSVVSIEAEIESLNRLFEAGSISEKTYKEKKADLVSKMKRALH